MRAYEAMFLFDPAVATDWANVEAEVNRLIGRANGEIVACKRWDERRLAYEIRGRKRACYVLTYFRAPSDRIVGLERDVQLSEHVLRALVLRVDHMTDDEMKAAVEKVPEPVVESDRGDRGDRGDRFDRGNRGDRGERGHHDRFRREAVEEPAIARPDAEPSDPAADAGADDEGARGSR